MEKVIRICELTGKVTVIAEGLTTEEAMALVKARASADELATYTRVTR